MTSPGAVWLRQVTEDDLPAFYEYQRDPESVEMAAFASRDRDAFLAHWTRILNDPDLIARTITVDGRVAGNVSSWEQDGERLVGYWVDRELWGRGVASRALAAFLEEMTARPVFAYVAHHNRGSIRVLEKCGFTVHTETVEPSPDADDGVSEVLMWLE